MALEPGGARRASPFRHYRLVDYLTQGYIVLVGLLILVFHGRGLRLWLLLVGAHAAILVADHALIRIAGDRKTGFLALLRAFYPMLLYTFLYCETHKLDRLFTHAAQDGFFIDLEQRLFGAQLSRTFMAAAPYVWVSEVFYLFYFSYYVMIFGVGMGLYLTRRRQFFHYLTLASFVFYLCYLTYIFLPVMGPHATESGVVLKGATGAVGPRVTPEAVQSGPFFNLMKLVYKLVEPEGGAAFPSSHVALAVAALWFSWTCFKYVRWLHLVAVIMLCLSTVYCGYHYAVDVLGGLATAALLVPVGELIYRRWRHLGDEAVMSDKC